MGLLIATIQRRQLRMERSNLQFQLLLITKAIATAGKSTNELMQVGTDYESDSIIAKRLQERQYKLKINGRIIELAERRNSNKTARN